MEERRFGFYIAPFSVEGEAEGCEYQEIGRLSDKWLTICGEFLDLNGNAFDSPWSGDLSHIRTSFTAASGGALIGFSVREVPANSIALASGDCPGAETEMIAMFVNSLRNVHAVRAVSNSPKPFEHAIELKERPVMIVVPWPARTISVEDHNVVRELAIHTAGAFFHRKYRFAAT
jgi:hypothetical protein